MGSYRRCRGFIISAQRCRQLPSPIMSPSDDEKDELLLSCRYGDIDDVRQFVETYGQEVLGSVHDENGNGVLHMVAGNGHVGECDSLMPLSCTFLTHRRYTTDILDYLLSIVPPSLLSAQNNAGSTPLHWAAINTQLEIAQKLIQCSGGPGNGLIDIKNTAGRSPLAEAEMAGWDEGAKYMVEVMNLEENDGGDDEHSVDDSKAAPDIEIEIQDAEGQVSKMKISGATLPSSS